MRLSPLKVLISMLILAEDITKHTKLIDKLVKIIANHENDLKSQENDLLKLKDELIQLEKLKQFLP